MNRMPVITSDPTSPVPPRREGRTATAPAPSAASVHTAGPRRRATGPAGCATNSRTSTRRAAPPPRMPPGRQIRTASSSTSVSVLLNSEET